ncbi:carboxylesterase/lipase family protein [Sutterella sp.]|uniref:carboxylesterase/lipase family protein n=1 Tax=Sutterella sp. TaxID=1981025 RepID=UPI0026DF6974|nr:carboxylesterase family protein [Sutterella sp.]MDO5531171.1 carboxylesterase family protein [Sutterella sp.]
MQRRELLKDCAALGAAAAVPAITGCTAAQKERTALPGDALETTVADAPAGRFRGFIRPGEPGVRVFLGIPFMKNPYEPVRRFLAPEPFERFEETVDCMAYGSVPLQPARTAKPSEPRMKGGDGPLCLNIWAPAEGGNLPVMVWVPGGGSINCDQNDARFEGTAFARDGVILVTLAYRVNVDGFMKVKGGDSNLGNRDIIAGLRWVKQNIAAFGGDPRRITAFGQSAGGTHLVDVIASPLAKGLLAGAIIQSPSAVAQWISDEQADRAARYVCDALGVEPAREALMSLPIEKLADFRPLAGKLAGDREWARFTCGNTSLFKGWVDGDLMPERPVDALARGAAAGLRVIAGSTHSEWRWYIVPNGQIDRIDEGAVARLLDGARLPASLSESYARAGRGTSPGDRFAQIQSDVIFRMPCVRLLESLAAGGADVWAYSFDWESPVTGKSGAKLGAAHTTDVPFVFGTVKAPRAVASVGTEPPASLVRDMHGAWAEFAKTGRAPWAPFSLQSRRSMSFSDRSHEVTDPWAFERLAVPDRR